MDRRQRRTRKAIFDAFEGLLLERHYREITVGQVIERADVGRSTFYAHFATKDDLLEQICAELFAHVFDGVESDPHTHEALETVSLEGVLAHLLYHLRDSHNGVGGKLLAEGEPHFSALFRRRIGDYLAPRMPERSSWVPRDLMQDLLVSCFCEAVVWWHAHDYGATPEELAHWYARTMGWNPSPPTHARTT